MLRLSLSGFLFEQNYVQQTVSFERFCSLAVEAGYTGVELRQTQVHPDTSLTRQHQMRCVLDDNGLSLTCLTIRDLPASDLQKRDERLRQYLELCRNMACPLLKISGPPQWMHDACQIASDSGVMLACNTHINSLIETSSDAIQYLNEVDHPNLGILYDPMHLAIAGDNVLSALNVLYPRICNVLVQCVRHARGDEPSVIDYNAQHFVKTTIDQEPLGDWPALLEQLRQRNYMGWITVIENTWPRGQQEDVAGTTARHIQHLWKRGDKNC